MTPRYTRRTAMQTALVMAAATPLGLSKETRAQGTNAVKVRITFNDQAMTAVLENNPSARDFASMLPLDDLTINNYADNEKISYLPRKLTEEGSGRFGDARPGDLCYYAPWGNLAFFYAGYRWSRGLIRLGRIDGSYAPLMTQGEFPLQIDIVR